MILFNHLFEKRFEVQLISFREDVVVLCASGTAVIVDLSYMLDLESVGNFGPPFIPFNANSLGTYGIGGQQTSIGRKTQDLSISERATNEGNEVIIVKYV